MRALDSLQLLESLAAQGIRFTFSLFPRSGDTGLALLRSRGVFFGTARSIPDESWDGGHLSGSFSLSNGAGIDVSDCQRRYYTVFLTDLKPLILTFILTLAIWRGVEW